ncbi:hypothetical protein Tco_0540516, partial [Tanacetum coccineum]
VYKISSAEVTEMFERIISRGRRLEDFIQKKLDDLKDNHKFWQTGEVKPQRSRIPLVKVRWNSKRGPEFTWEREDQFEKKYPHLFTKTTPSSSAAL